MTSIPCGRCGYIHEGGAGSWQCYRLCSQHYQELCKTQKDEIERLRAENEWLRADLSEVRKAGNVATTDKEGE